MPQRGKVIGILIAVGLYWTVASVEVTSEAADFPVEAALTGNGQQFWQADTPGSQTIRLLFDTTQTVRFIRLVFREEQSPRTQEFVLRWRPAPLPSLGLKRCAPCLLRQEILKEDHLT